MKFSELGLNDMLLERCESLGFTEPTPIQVKAIPIIKEGSDLIGCAETGTGKNGGVPAADDTETDGGEEAWSKGINNRADAGTGFTNNGSVSRAFHEKAALRQYDWRRKYEEADQRSQTGH